MGTSIFHLLAICCTLLFVEISLAEMECNEYVFGPCVLTVDHWKKEDSNGLSIEFDISVNTSQCQSNCPPGCQVKKPDDPDYVELKGYGYYKYHITPLPWDQAWNVCKSEGGHLSVFNSEEEATFVGAIPTNQYDWAFIGFTDCIREGNYVTIFDQTLEEAGWNTWQPPNPNGGTRENCGVTFPNGKLGDYICSDPRTFFCEISCQDI